jgi:hypothetical protein
LGKEAGNKRRYEKRLPEGSLFVCLQILLRVKASCAHISNIEQMQMSLKKAVAFYPKGLFEYVLTDREHISYLPLAGMQERSRYRIKVIYNRHSDKLTLIKKLLACFE